MKYFLSQDAVLKWLETTSLYHMKKDDLYELDEVSFEFLRECSSDSGCNSQNGEFINYCLNEGILTKDRIIFKRPPVIKSPVPSLRYLELQITDRCNLKCKHCFIGDKKQPPSPNPSPQGRGKVVSLPSREGKSKESLIKKKQIISISPFLKPYSLSTRDGREGIRSRINKSPLPLRERDRVREKNKFNELSVNQIRTVLEEFEKMQGLRVLISGGEPLMHRGFEKINDMLPDFFIRKVLFTNGLLLKKSRLKGLNVDEIQVSIDGLEDAHDSLRGKGTFNLAVKAVKRAIDSGFEVSISTMVHPENLNDFEEMNSLFKDLGIKDWTVDVPCITGRLAQNSSFQISPEQGGQYLRYGFGEGLHSGASGFACGLHLMAVMADGRVSKCTFYADSPVGRIEEGLRNCWQRISPIRLNKLKCDCDYIEICRGGCRYRALLLGDPFGKDLYKCNLYGINYKN